MNLFKIQIWIYKLKQKIKAILFPIDPNIDQAYLEAIEFIKGKSYITYHQLQKGLNIGYARTINIMEILEKNNKIGPIENGKEKREIL